MRNFRKLLIIFNVKPERRISDLKVEDPPEIFKRETFKK